MKQNKPGYFGFFILAMSFYLRWESLKIIKLKEKEKSYSVIPINQQQEKQKHC